MIDPRIKDFGILYTQDDVNYLIAPDNTAMVMGVNSAFSRLVIPKEVNGAIVTAIDASAFENDLNLMSVELPDTIKEIGAMAFYYCENLDEIILPDGLETIGFMAFTGCDSLKEVNLGSSLKEIGYEAFANCGLTNIVLPEGLKQIGYRAFSGNDIVKVSIPDSIEEVGVACFDSPDLELNEKNHVLYLGNEHNPYLVAYTLPDYYCMQTVIDDDCKVICDGMFSSLNSEYSFESPTLFCNGVVSIKIGRGVKFIPLQAFDYLPRLIEIFNLSTVDCSPESEYFAETEFKPVAYFTSEDAESIIIDDEEYDISYYEHNGKKILAYSTGDKAVVNVPPYIDEIAPYAFECDEMVEINLPDSVKKIGIYAFLFCPNLSKINVGNGVKEVGYNAFYGCEELEYLDSEPLYAKFDEDGDFILDENIQVKYLGNAENKHVIGVIHTAEELTSDWIITQREPNVLAFNEPM